MNRNSKIQLTDTVIDAMVKVSDGNPGAITVLMGLSTQNPTIDPDDIMGKLGPVLTLDSHGIYGADIWMLFKDICKGSHAHVLALLRAVQLGFLAEDKLKHAIQNYGEGVDVIEMYNKVKERLPLFDNETK